MCLTASDLSLRPGSRRMQLACPHRAGWEGSALSMAFPIGFRVLESRESPAK